MYHKKVFTKICFEERVKYNWLLIVKKKSIASSGFGDVRNCQNISTDCFQQECDAFYIILEMPFVQISNKQDVPIIILYETNRQNVIIFF